MAVAMDALRDEVLPDAPRVAVEEFCMAAT
jgi:hypothetical protein